MKLEVGKSYVNRRGEVVKISNKFETDENLYPFYDGQITYSYGGKVAVWQDNDDDLIAEIAEVPEVKDTPDDTDTQPNDGGPAFPVTPTDRSGQIEATQWGMSLREWYAGMALAGISYNYHETGGTPEQVAGWAFKYADEMIRASRK